MKKYLTEEEAIALHKSNQKYWYDLIKEQATKDGKLDCDIVQKVLKQIRRSYEKNKTSK